MSDKGMAMDPDKAWADAQDESLSMAERIDQVIELVVWFQRGGFQPTGYTDEGWSALRRMWIDNPTTTGDSNA